MSSFSEQKILTFKSSVATIAKGSVVIAGATKGLVALGSGATQKAIGIAQSAVTAINDLVEVAMPGGGGKAKLGVGGCAFGDYLTCDASGTLVVTTSANDRVMAVAMDAGSAGDLVAVEVVSFNY